MDWIKSQMSTYFSPKSGYSDENAIQSPKPSAHRTPIFFRHNSDSSNSRIKDRLNFDDIFAGSKHSRKRRHDNILTSSLSVQPSRPKSSLPPVTVKLSKTTSNLPKLFRPEPPSMKLSTFIQISKDLAEKRPAKRERIDFDDIFKDHKHRSKRRKVTEDFDNDSGVYSTCSHQQASNRSTPERDLAEYSPFNVDPLMRSDTALLSSLNTSRKWLTNSLPSDIRTLTGSDQDEFSRPCTPDSISDISSVSTLKSSIPIYKEVSIGTDDDFEPCRHKEVSTNTETCELLETSMRKQKSLFGSLSSKHIPVADIINDHAKEDDRLEKLLKSDTVPLENASPKLKQMDTVLLPENKTDTFTPVTNSDVKDETTAKTLLNQKPGITFSGFNQGQSISESQSASVLPIIDFTTSKQNNSVSTSSFSIPSIFSTTSAVTTSSSSASLPKINFPAPISTSTTSINQTVASILPPLGAFTSTNTAFSSQLPTTKSSFLASSSASVQNTHISAIPSLSAITSANVLSSSAPVTKSSFGKTGSSLFTSEMKPLQASSDVKLLTSSASSSKPSLSAGFVFGANNADTSTSSSFKFSSSADSSNIFGGQKSAFGSSDLKTTPFTNAPNNVFQNNAVSKPSGFNFGATSSPFTVNSSQSASNPPVSTQNIFGISNSNSFGSSNQIINPFGTERTASAPFTFSAATSSSPFTSFGTSSTTFPGANTPFSGFNSANATTQQNSGGFALGQSNSSNSTLPPRRIRIPVRKNKKK